MFDLTDLRVAEKTPTLADLLLEGARLTPERELMSFEDGTIWTWRTALENALGAAGVLSAQGVSAGDRVTLFMGNCPELLKAWWGTALIGAVSVPLNPAYKGQMLADAVNRADAKLMVTSADRLGIVADLGVPVLLTDALTTCTAVDTGLIARTHPWDPHACVFTSGTTGPSKASVTTFAGLMATWSWTEHCGHLNADDVLLMHMPLFHLSGLSPIVNMIRIGGRICFRSRPALSSFWEVANQTRATITMLLGTMAEHLAAQPQRPAERDHTLRIVSASPLPKDPTGFVQRFGIQGLISSFGSTEMGVQVVQSVDLPVRLGSSGRVREGFEVRVVDENEFPVPLGQVGEALVRSDAPWITSQGYLKDADATVAAWRHGWFHTGDAIHIDDEGYVYFHERYKDSLRRRGENVSSFEVEREVLAYPGIVDAACTAAPSDTPGDDEVKIFYTTAPGVVIDLPDVVEFLVERMPHFMVPRFYEEVDELPRTATFRVQKFKLRERGNSAATWDREAAGLSVTRHGLVRA